MKGVRIVKIYKNFRQLYRIISRSQEEKNIGCNDTSPSFLREICEEAKSSILEVINEMSENKTGALNTSINKNDQFFGISSLDHMFQFFHDLGHGGPVLMFLGPHAFY